MKQNVLLLKDFFLLYLMKNNRVEILNLLKHSYYLSV